jgi:uncharacterized protein (TIGR03084 family)
MLQQAQDFRAESEALAALVEPLDDEAFRRTTLFREWTIDDVIAHLHLFNVAADLSLNDEPGFAALWGRIVQAMKAGATLRDFAEEWLAGVRGVELFEAWRAFYPGMAERYAAADPKRRLRWAGPDMSVRSSITARQMETWAHGQAVYDLLGVERVDEDRIGNIAFLGVNTFAWTFRNRGLDVPETVPCVRLSAPSGTSWTWHEPDRGESISGSATGFCQVVTQTRNVADTDLVVVGDTATRWMEMAQCFAGPPVDPPAPGTRRAEHGRRS